MKQSDIKILLTWSGINLLFAPVFGWALAESRMPWILALYLMLAVFMAPLMYIIWCDHFRSPHSSPEPRSHGGGGK